jgi:hypothetical protein
MNTLDIIWLACGAATVYPYYRFAVKPPSKRGGKETSWKDLDPIFFPLVTIICWPICLFTILLALYLQRLWRKDDEEAEALRMRVRG